MEKSRLSGRIRQQLVSILMELSPGIQKKAEKDLSVLIGPSLIIVFIPARRFYK